MSEFDAMRELLPAWFVPRMMGDTWSFGFLLESGTVIGVSTILAVHRDAAGGLWLDVELLERDQIDWFARLLGLSIITAPTSRTKASIRADQIVAAFELADT